MAAHSSAWQVSDMTHGPNIWVVSLGLLCRWCKIPILLMAAIVFPHAKGIIYAGSDCYLKGDIDEYLKLIRVQLTPNSPLFVASEPEPLGWVKWVQAEGVYDSEKAMNGDTVLFVPRSTRAKEALWRLWTLSLNVPSPLEAKNSQILVLLQGKQLSPAGCSQAVLW